MNEHRKKQILLKLARKAPSAVPKYPRDSYGDLQQRLGGLEERETLPGKWEDDPEGYGKNWIVRSRVRPDAEAREVFS